MITLIFAQDQAGGIGKDGGLPWPKIKEDMTFFKDTTTGHVVIMGRKTFDSLKKPLPNRTNVVLTNNKDWTADGVEVFHTVADVLEAYKDNDDVFVIGGSEIYSQMIGYADRILLTKVFGAFDADTFFRFDADEWVFNSFEQVRDDEGKLVCTFESYSRPDLKEEEPEADSATSEKH